MLASALLAVALYLASRRSSDVEYAAAFQFATWTVAVLVALFALVFGLAAIWGFVRVSQSWFRYPVALVMLLAITAFITWGILDAYFQLCADGIALICLSI
ncbi:hypothetical protein CEK00_04760 [Stenotrophomonas maltophilia]|uniref:Transmembrane protein n=1 Tax=Stenotrophomonas maltophilia TaxID=40324 RepID=A0A270NM63_STEMA|nr:hypothetical protein CEK00_04760 [Stenotrophomonas maltophilia]